MPDMRQIRSLIPRGNYVHEDVRYLLNSRGEDGRKGGTVHTDEEIARAEAMLEE